MYPKPNFLLFDSMREECVKKVKGRDMGYLFENMEKMDIQEERRKTAEARKEAQKAQEACSRAQKNTVLLCQKYGASKENAIQELMDTCSLELEEAQQQVALYWKE